jgi:hypothetical protein
MVLFSPTPCLGSTASSRQRPDALHKVRHWGRPAEVVGGGYLPERGGDSGKGEEGDEDV